MAFVVGHGEHHVGDGGFKLSAGQDDHVPAGDVRDHGKILRGHADHVGLAAAGPDDGPAAVVDIDFGLSAGLSAHQLIEQAGGQEDLAVFGNFRGNLGFDGDFPVRAGKQQTVWIAFHHDALIRLLDRTDSDGAGDHAQAVVDFADVDVKLHLIHPFVGRENETGLPGP